MIPPSIKNVLLLKVLIKRPFYEFKLTSFRGCKLNLVAEQVVSLQCPLNDPDGQGLQGHHIVTNCGNMLLVGTTQILQRLRGTQVFLYLFVQIKKSCGMCNSWTEQFWTKVSKTSSIHKYSRVANMCIMLKCRNN